MYTKRTLYIALIAGAFIVVIVSFGFICGDGEENEGGDTRATRDLLDQNSFDESIHSDTDIEFLNSVVDERLSETPARTDTQLSVHKSKGAELESKPVDELKSDTEHIYSDIIKVPNEKPKKRPIKDKKEPRELVTKRIGRVSLPYKPELSKRNRKTPVGILHNICTATGCEHIEFDKIDPAILKSLGEKRNKDRRELYALVQLTDWPTIERSEVLESKNVHILSMYGSHVLVRLPFNSDLINTLSQSEEIKWISFIPERLKIDPDLTTLKHQMAENPALMSTLKGIPVTIALFDSDRDGRMAQRLKEHGVKLIEYNSDLFWYTAVIPLAQLEAVLNEDFVLNVELVKKATPSLNQTTSLIGVDYIRTLKSGGGTGRYDGSGIQIGMIDSGFDFTHDDIVPAMCGKDFTGEGNPFLDPAWHGTLLLDVMSGTGAKSNGNYTGIAIGSSNYFGARIVKSDNTSPSSTTVESAMTWLSQGITNGNTCEGSFSKPPSIVNISYGSSGNNLTGTDSISILADWMVWNYKQLVVTGAGNGGPAENSIKSPGVAKNVVTVGGLLDAVVKDSSDNKMYYPGGVHPKSSQCCTGDERIKPDVSAGGLEFTGVKKDSSNSYDTDTYNDNKTWSGSSLASAHIAAAAATVMQHQSSFKNNPAALKAHLYGATWEPNAEYDNYFAHYIKDTTWTSLTFNSSGATGELLCTNPNSPITISNSYFVGFYFTWIEKAASQGASNSVINFPVLIVKNLNLPQTGHGNSYCYQSGYNGDTSLCDIPIDWDYLAYPWFDSEFDLYPYYEAFDYYGGYYGPDNFIGLSDYNADGKYQLCIYNDGLTSSPFTVGVEVVSVNNVSPKTTLSQSSQSATIACDETKSIGSVTVSRDSTVESDVYITAQTSSSYLKLARIETSLDDGRTSISYSDKATIGKVLGGHTKTSNIYVTASKQGSFTVSGKVSATTQGYDIGNYQFSVNVGASSTPPGNFRSSAYEVYSGAVYDLDWDPAGCGTVVKYQVQENRSTGQFNDEAYTTTLETTRTDQAFSHTVNFDTNYYYRVRACYNNSCEYSDEHSDWANLASPGYVKVKYVNCSISISVPSTVESYKDFTISWKPKDTCPKNLEYGLNEYYIYSDGELSSGTGLYGRGPATSFVHQQHACYFADKYQYEIDTCIEGGSCNSIPDVSSSPVTIKPEQFTITVPDSIECGEGFDISWEEPEDCSPLADYILEERKVDLSSWHEIYRGDNQYYHKNDEETDVCDGNQYQYRVRSCYNFDEDNCTPYVTSNEVESFCDDFLIGKIVDKTVPWCAEVDEQYWLYWDVEENTCSVDVQILETNEVTDNEEEIYKGPASGIAWKHDQTACDEGYYYSYNAYRCDSETCYGDMTSGFPNPIQIRATCEDAYKYPDAPTHVYEADVKWNPNTQERTFNINWNPPPGDKEYILWYDVYEQVADTDGDWPSDFDDIYIDDSYYRGMAKDVLNSYQYSGNEYKKYSPYITTHQLETIVSSVDSFRTSWYGGWDLVDSVVSSGCEDKLGLQITRPIGTYRYVVQGFVKMGESYYGGDYSDPVIVEVTETPVDFPDKKNPDIEIPQGSIDTDPTTIPEIKIPVDTNSGDTYRRKR